MLTKSLPNSLAVQAKAVFQECVEIVECDICIDGYPASPMPQAKLDILSGLMPVRHRLLRSLYAT